MRALPAYLASGFATVPVVGLLCLDIEAKILHVQCATVILDAKSSPSAVTSKH